MFNFLRSLQKYFVFCILFNLHKLATVESTPWTSNREGPPTLDPGEPQQLDAVHCLCWGTPLNRCQRELDGISSTLETGNKGKRLCQPLGSDTAHSSLGKNSTFPASVDRNSQQMLAGSLLGSTLVSLDQCSLVKTTPRASGRSYLHPVCDLKPIQVC